MNPIGINILSQYVQNQAALITYLKASNPAAVVVMDSPALAQQIKAMLPQCTVIHRAFNANDPHWETATTPQAWLTANAPAATNGIVIQAYNEPAPGNLDAFFDWIVELVAICPANITLAFPAFAVGNPNENDILNGVYDRLLRIICGTRHWLILHEYIKTDPAQEAPYLCGRFIFWLARAKTLKLSIPKIVIAEHGRDVGGGKNDGWKGVGWTEQQYFDLLAKAQTTLYQMFNIPVCVYCWGVGANDDWLSFDIEQAPTLQSLIVQFGKEHPMNTLSVPTPAPTPVTVNAPTDAGTKVLITGFPAGVDFRNIRIQPEATATDLGNLNVKDVVIAHTDSLSKGWAYIERAADGVKGWTLWTGIAFTPVDAPAPEPTPTPAPTPEPMIEIPVSVYNKMYTAYLVFEAAFKEMPGPSSGSGF